MYNPAVMSKLNLVREALEKDIFHTDYFVWVDGGITHAFDKEAFLK
jgi:pentose-5-phosphate-3-epimerase